MTQLPPNIETQDIDHLGLIAGIIDEIGLVDKIDELLGTHPQEQVSAGQVVKAMILNCLGFLSAPLYLFHQFFIGKATEHLIGEGVRPEYLNDDRLGRVLDKLHSCGLSRVFLEIALLAAQRFKVSARSMHLDGSSFYVHGQYLNSNNGQPKVESAADASLANQKEHLVLAPAWAVQTSTCGEKIPDSDNEPKAIEITYGYSRDHRPDLKQFVIDIFSSGDGDVPLFIQVGDGNESEATKFPQLIKEFKQQWTFEEVKVFVVDSVLYSKDNIVSLANLPWISRVPLTIAAAKHLLLSIPVSDFVNSRIEGYKFATRESEYGGVKQRWLVVESEARRKADISELSKRLDKQQQQHSKALQCLCRQEFNCAADARVAALRFERSLKFHQLENVQIVEQVHYRNAGRPKKKADPERVTYHIKAKLVENQKIIESAQNQAGRFILATNLTDTEEWAADEILREYKEQQCAERGFRFLKDPLFFASSVFVKSAQRVAALAMVMGLCLLVYTLGQRKLRQSLSLADETIPNQVGKPTQRPTLRWVFQCFQAVHLVWVNGVKLISNLTEARQKILHFLGSACQKYYLLC